MDNFDNLLNVSAVPQGDDRKAAFIAESRNNRSRCYELSEQMTKEIAADSGAFQTYLDVQSRFDRYTANNAILITAQKPDAQKLGDYGYWRDRGAFVKRPEQRSPVLIMEPGRGYTREDGSMGTYYNAKKLYDISQTSFRDRQEKSRPEVDERLLIRAVVSNPPADIVPAGAEQMPEGKGALFSPEENCIYVRKGMGAEDIFRSLVPELALAGFADGDKEYDRNEGAFHAYCVSYMLCKKYGFDTQGFDFSHAPEMFEGMEPQEVRGELAKARDALYAISSRMAKVFSEERRAQQAQENGGQDWQPAGPQREENSRETQTAENRRAQQENHSRINGAQGNHAYSQKAQYAREAAR